MGAGATWNRICEGMLSIASLGHVFSQCHFLKRFIEFNMHPTQIFDFSDQVVAITGAARGIGLATARAYALAGAHVALLDIEGEAAQSAASEIAAECAATGRRIEGLEVDVTQPESVTHAIDEVAAWQGRLDVLVNNAGVALRRPTLELSLDDWNRVIQVNLTGVFLCAQAAGRHMVPARKGCIVNTASIMGLSGGGLYPNISYQSTKGAVVNLTRALAVEWAPHQVRVNAVAPTWVRTDFIRPLLAQPELVARIEGMTPLGRLAEAEDIVAAILYLSSQAASMVTGHTLPVDGGFLAQ